MRIAGGLYFITFGTILLGCSQGSSKSAVTDTTSHKQTSDRNLVVKDTVSFTYKKHYAKDHYCDSCGYIALQYPLIKNQPALQNNIAQVLFGYIDEPYTSQKNFEETFEKFSKSYEITRDSNEIASVALTFDYDSKIILQDSSLIVIDFYEETSGGAHPNHHHEFLNWNTKTDKEIKLNDLFVPNYKKALTKIAEHIFQEDEKRLNNGQQIYYNFENGIFALNNTFHITSKGLNFFYNDYEIKPYSEGPTNLLIPYAQIKSLLRPNTVLTQYIK